MVRVALPTAATLVLVVGVGPLMLLLVPIATGTALAHRRHITAASVAVVEVLRVRGGRRLPMVRRLEPSSTTRLI